MRYLIVVFLVLSNLITPSGINAQTVVIENNLLTLQVNNQMVALESKKISDLKIRNLLIPGQIMTIEKMMVSDNIWGDGQSLKVDYSDGRKITFCLYNDNPFLYIHTIMVNSSPQDVRTEYLDIASIEMSIGNMSGPLTTLGTGGFAPAQHARGSYTYSLLAEPNSRHSILTAWLTQKQGIGLMIPSLDKNRKVYQVRTKLEFGNYLVRSGNERNTDILLIGLFEDGREALELYGDYLAKVYEIKLPKKPEIYSTWYHRNLSGSGASTEKMILENADFAKKRLADFGLNTFQIDDHWQSSMNVSKTELGKGPLKTFVESNSNYPSGMKHTAEQLEKRGFTSGIWFMPFSGDAHNPYFPKEIFAKHKWTNKGSCAIVRGCFPPHG